MREARLKAVPLLLYAAFPPLTLRDAQRSRPMGCGHLSVACKMAGIGI